MTSTINYRRVHKVKASAYREWHVVAETMRADGATNTAIAQEVGHSQSLISRYFRPKYIETSDASEEIFIKKHKPHKVRQLLKPKSAVIATARAFASGEIDRAALMERIAA